MDKKLNGFSNGRDTTDSVGGKEPFTIYEPPINEKPDAYGVGLDLYQEEYKPSLQEAVEVLCNALREDEKNVYNLWIDQIQSHVFDEFRKFGGDKPVNGLYEKEITISYKDISELCFNGTKNFLNLLINK